MKWTILTSLALISVMFSGCSAGETEQGILTKTLVASFTADSDFESADAFTSTYTYLHQGDEINVADVTVTYVEGEFAWDKPMSRYTPLETLQVGDSITIDGIPAFAELRIENGGLIAKRAPVEHDWLLAEGTPIPLAGTGSAAWDWSADMDLHLGWDHFQFTEDYGNSYETTSIDNMSVEIAYEFQGGFSIDSGRTLALSADATGIITGNGNVDLETFYFERGSEYNYTETQSASFDADLQLAGGIDVEFLVEDSNLLEVTAEGFGEVDGTLIGVYNDERMDLTAFLPMRESFGPETETIERMALDQDFAALLDFYGTTLEVGDGLKMTFAAEDLEISYDLIAARKEPVMTPAGSVDAIFLAGSVVMDAAVWEFGPLEFGGWITEEGLPVKSSWSGDLDIPLQELLELAEQFDDSMVAPTNLEYGAAFSMQMQMTSNTGDLRSAPWMFLAGPIGFLTQLE